MNRTSTLAVDEDVDESVSFTSVHHFTRFSQLTPKHLRALNLAPLNVDENDLLESWRMDLVESLPEHIREHPDMNYVIMTDNSRLRIRYLDELKRLGLICKEKKVQSSHFYSSEINANTSFVIIKKCNWYDGGKTK
jgi:hypothetical protein